MQIVKLKVIVLFVLATLLSSCSKVKISAGESYDAVAFPDGSFAYLNKNSTVEYDRDFTERKVKQNGEVFYEVKKGNEPFVVETESGEVTVLGTEFNVKSSKDDFELEVESGSVELKVGKLVKRIKRGQKAAYKEVDKKIKLANAEFKHKQWIANLEKEFKRLGKEIKKESENAGKEVKREFKKLKEKLKD